MQNALGKKMCHSGSAASELATLWLWSVGLVRVMCPLA